MAKQMLDHVDLLDFETKAEKFISLTFDLCEKELRLCTQRHHTQPIVPRRIALQTATLSIQESVKTFLAIVRIKPE